MSLLQLQCLYCAHHHSASGWRKGRSACTRGPQCGWPPQRSWFAKKVILGPVVCSRSPPSMPDSGHRFGHVRAWPWRTADDGTYAGQTVESRGLRLASLFQEGWWPDARIPALDYAEVDPSGFSPLERHGIEPARHHRSQGISLGLSGMRALLSTPCAGASGARHHRGYRSPRTGRPLA